MFWHQMIEKSFSIYNLVHSNLTDINFFPSTIVFLSKSHRLSAGIQTSFNNRSADFSNLSFYSQWNGSEFDPSIPIDEPNQLASFSYVDAGLGLHYSFDKRSNSSSGGKELAFSSGFFIQHINQPKLRYNALTLDRLNAKYGLYVSSKIGVNTVLPFCC